MNSSKNFSKNVLLSMLLLGSFASLIVADNAQEAQERQRLHAKKLYHAIATGDQVCIDRIMKESTVPSALQLKAVIDQRESYWEKRGKTVYDFFLRSVAAAIGYTVASRVCKELMDTVSKPSSAAR